MVRQFCGNSSDIKGFYLLRWDVLFGDEIPVQAHVLKEHVMADISLVYSFVMRYDGVYDHNYISSTNPLSLLLWVDFTGVHEKCLPS